MFPSVDAEQRLIPTNDRILVGVGLNRDVPSLSVLDQPGPARALNSRESSIELLLEIFQTTIRSVDSLRQLARRRLATARVLGSEVFPEEGMVEMTAAVEIDQRLEGDLGGNVAAGFRSCVLIGSSIVAVHVGLVVFAVV